MDPRDLRAIVAAAALSALLVLAPVIALVIISR